MENIALYIAKACALTVVFYGAYYLMLRKETFFRANRWFLLAGMATSVLLPLAVFTKIIWVQPAPVSPVVVMSLSQLSETQNIPQPLPAPAPAAFEFEWWMAALAVYALVSVALLARLIIDFKRVLSFFKGQNGKRIGQFTIIDSKSTKSPFSFFNYIVYNSSTLDSGELQGIISHEKVHSSQRHSIDMLLAQLFCIVFWFNPFAWFYKKAIAQNLEFIADAEAVKHVADVTAYQKTLLKMTLDLQGSSIASHFYQPLIKKRIIMINKPKSKKHNTAKYAVVLPLLAVFVGFFQIKTEAREKAPKVQQYANLPDTLIIQSFKYTITPYTKEEDIKENMAAIAKTYSINASCDAGRNNAGEIISVKVALSGKGLDKVYEENGKTLINNLTIEVSRDANGKLSARFSNPVEIKAGNATIPLNTNNSTMTVTSANLTEFDDVLVVVDGVKQGKASDWQKIDPKNIATINVYRNEAETVAKYGPEAKKGVIEITTRKDVPAQTTVFTTTITEPLTPGNNAGVSAGFIELKNSGSPDYKKAHLTLNGKEISVSEFESINPNDVTMILTVPAGSQSNISSFGPKAANGVIMITAKKVGRWEAQGGVKYSDDDNDGKREMSLIENSGFIINKNTTEAQLKQYVIVLARSGIKMTYGSIKRNSSGEMTKLKIELTRNGNKSSATYESSTGIPTFYAGEKDGDVAIYTTK